MLIIFCVCQAWGEKGKQHYLQWARYSEVQQDHQEWELRTRDLMVLDWLSGQTSNRASSIERTNYLGLCEGASEKPSWEYNWQIAGAAWGGEAKRFLGEITVMCFVVTSIFSLYPESSHLPLQPNHCISCGVFYIESKDIIPINYLLHFCDLPLSSQLLEKIPQETS